MKQHFGKKINHIAIIPDGNRRYAQKQLCSLAQSYAKAITLFFTIIKEAVAQNVDYLTFFCLSKQNLVRPAKEIIPIVQLLDRAFKKIWLAPKYLWFKNHIAINILSDNQWLQNQGKLRTYFRRIESRVAKIAAYQLQISSKRMITLTLAINYGGREEIIAAINGAQRSQKIRPVNEYFSSSSLPDIDICIRTGNSRRISNFLLWKLAYTELFFLDCFWPEFTRKNFIQVIDDFKNQRQRRYGV